ncbi:MAG TPA: efflux RND transporter permease subunit [Steroidobacteraceae bacterium]|jgi:multidrug efflux pump
MSRFFIDRPVFAWALAILVMLAGGLAVFTLPVAQYPDLAPPGIAISATYPGASAETVETTVAQVIEQQLSGLDNLLYFTTESDKDGSIAITCYFAQGTDSNIAQVQVQNKLQLAIPRLPQPVQQQGLRVAKATKNFLLVVSLVSTDDSLQSGDISDFIASSVQDAISRTPGVGDYQLFGAQYAMRVWLDPGKLNNYGLTPLDVSTAIRSQNIQVAAGELGGLPSRPGQELNATIVGPSYLQTPEQFGQILLKVRPNGAQVLLRDVARIAFGGEAYAVDQKYNGHPASGLAIRLESGANALDTIKAIKATLDGLRPTFPQGLEAFYPLDAAPFVKQSMTEVAKTLGEAILLVFLIMLLFLQNVRATLIPTIAVPIVLLGTCGVLAAAHFSINSLTMFAMVLAVGLLVDDAIVVVENVERVMREEHLPPKEATRRSMDQIKGALVGIGLMLTAVFLPMAFFSGSSGVIYRQFAVTIVASVTLSILVALIFTPALCATLLKRTEHGDISHRGVYGWFNSLYARTQAGHGRGLASLLRHPGRAFIILAVVLAVLGVSYAKLPGGFLPDEDQGMMFVQIGAPPGATGAHVTAVLDQVTQYLLKDEGAAVEGVLEVRGFSFGGHGQNSGLCFIKLKPWAQRRGARNKVQEIANRLTQHFAGSQEAVIIGFAPPAALELGNASGFDLELVDRTGIGHKRLMEARNELVKLAGSNPDVVAVRANGLDDEPQYRISIDRQKAGALGLTLSDINDTIASAWGSSYVNDFLDRGRVKRVFIQGDVDSRMLPQDLESWYVRNGAGQMVPFSAFAHGQWTQGSPKLERYNGVSSIEILGAPAPGRSTGAAIAAMEGLLAKMPQIGYAWTGLSFEEKAAGSKAVLLYILSLAVVFLCLSALYESWSIPVAVLLVVPLGVVGAVSATYWRGLANDVYFQVGMLTTIGLSAKNAILIVEFAKEAYERGSSLIDAATEAARMRLRPILMTSLAFAFGVAPLAISTGAGSGGQNAIGTGVVGGMLTATLFAVFLVPVFFVSILRLFRVKRAPVEEMPALAPGADTVSR